jgi:hypothetical protein
LEFIQRRENMVFLAKDFLTQGGRGKIGIKITRVISMNLGIFGQNFRIFGLIKG